ncbi:MAG: serine/threonine protein kinase [Acidobacteria bacterium]|nr:serine/threonine protein kinase [Acidobacteriota bacterium]
MDTLLLHRYRLYERLGIGASASVHRAIDELLDRPVAVKIFSVSSLEHSPGGAAAEIALLSRLSHPFLCTILDAGFVESELDGPRPLLVMEFHSGTNLQQHLKSGPMEPESVAALGTDLAEVLSYVHAQGVIHRDVKPANILLPLPGANIHPTLIDVGIARTNDDATATLPGVTIGTASYLSPEQALGEPVHASADVYSLGLVLLECLTGCRAFGGSALESSLARLLRDPSVPAWLGSEWGELLTSMTQRDPAMRPSAQKAQLALAALSQCSVGVLSAP